MIFGYENLIKPLKPNPENANKLNMEKKKVI